MPQTDTQLFKAKSMDDVMLFYLLLGNRLQQFEKLSFAFKPWGQDGQVSQKLLIWENTVHCSSMPLLPMGDELNPSHTVWVFTSAQKQGKSSNGKPGL